MAVTVTNIFQGTDSSINDIIATADADAAAVVPHGLGGAVAPGEVYITPRNVAIPKTAATGVVDTTNVNLVLGVVVGSGNAAAQLRVITKRPHSVGR